MKKRKVSSNPARGVQRQWPALRPPQTAAHPSAPSLTLSGSQAERAFNLAGLEKRLCYRFGRYPELARLALLHPAVSREDHSERRPNNERLEYLGDAILSAIVADSLYRQLPGSPEGELSKLRAAIVSREACETYFVKLDLVEFLDFGPVPTKVHKQLARTRNIRANAFEAILGAIYLDGGYEAAMAFFLTHFAEDLLRSQAHPAPNYKSSLQEWASQQKNTVLEPPSYELVKRSGTAHSPVFHVRVSMRMQTHQKPLVCHASNQTKRQAEQLAAKAMLRQLGVVVEQSTRKGMETATAIPTVRSSMKKKMVAYPASSSEEISTSRSTTNAASSSNNLLVPRNRQGNGRDLRSTVDAVRRSTDLELVLSAAYGGKAASLADLCEWFPDAYPIPVAIACLSHFAIIGSAMANADGLPQPLFEQLVWAVVLDRSILTLADDSVLITREERLPSGQRMLRLDSQSAGGSDAPPLESLALGAEYANFFVARRVVVPRSEKTTTMGMFVRFHGSLVPEKNCLDGRFVDNDATQAWLTALVATVALMIEAEMRDEAAPHQDTDETEMTCSHAAWTRAYIREAIREWSTSPSTDKLAKLRLGCARVLHAINNYGLLHWRHHNASACVYASMLVQFARIWLHL